MRSGTPELSARMRLRNAAAQLIYLAQLARHNQPPAVCSSSLRAEFEKSEMFHRSQLKSTLHSDTPQKTLRHLSRRFLLQVRPDFRFRDESPRSEHEVDGPDFNGRLPEFPSPSNLCIYPSETSAIRRLSLHTKPRESSPFARSAVQASLLLKSQANSQRSDRFLGD